MFDPATGLWCFGKKSPINQAVDPEPYVTRLFLNGKKRNMIEVQNEFTYCFKPAISDNCYLCRINLDFFLAINLVFACCFIVFLSVIVSCIMKD